MILNDGHYSLLEHAISEVEEDLTLYLGKHGNSQVDFGKYNSGMPSIVLDEYRDADSAIRVPARPLDEALASLVPRFNPDVGTLVKIDVEGAEMKVISGMPMLLENRSRMALIVELLFERDPDACTAIEALLRSKGFEMRELTMQLVLARAERRSGTFLFLRQGDLSAGAVDRSS